MSKRDYYEVLGVERGSSEADLKKAQAGLKKSGMKSYLIGRVTKGPSEVTLI